MVAGVGAGGADAGGDELSFGGKDGPEGGDFFRRTHKAFESGGGGEGGEELDLLGRIFLNANFGEVGFVHTRENGDAEDEWGVFGVISGSLGGAEHFGAATGVDGEHLHIEPRGTGDGFGDGVGDIVKF